jgi:hypothetical protein
MEMTCQRGAYVQLALSAKKSFPPQRSEAERGRRSARSAAAGCTTHSFAREIRALRSYAVATRSPLLGKKHVGRRSAGLRPAPTAGLQFAVEGIVRDTKSFLAVGQLDLLVGAAFEGAGMASFDVVAGILVSGNICDQRIDIGLRCRRGLVGPRRRAGAAKREGAHSDQSNQGNVRYWDSHCPRPTTRRLLARSRLPFSSERLAYLSTIVPGV